MKDYIAGFLQKAYGLINPEYARNKRMEKFDCLVESGQLEKMCASEIHKLFGIKRISNEF
jgi:hypothetical protein